MKNILKIFLISSLVLGTLGVSEAMAEDIRVVVNSETVEFDTPPVIKNGRTLIPIRAAAEKMGLKVVWEESTRTASIISSEKAVNLTIDSNILVDDGNAVEMDTVPEIINDRTCLPIRAVAEAFGSVVSWDEENRIVYINAPDTNKLISFDGTFGEGEISYYYSDDLFSDTSGINYGIAELSAVAALSAANEKNVTDFLDKNGFSDVRVYNYDRDSEIKADNEHKSDFALAKKIISGKEVIALIIRGTCGNEWYSNFDVWGPNNEVTNTHYGFEAAADEIVAAVKEYSMSGNVWICGHSRGGGVANIVAQKLYSEGRDVFAYTFASPNTVQNQQANQNVPVYNFVSKKDIITRIPLSESGWDYSRHGVTIEMDSYDEENMSVKFQELTLREYKPVRLSDTDAAVESLYLLAPDVSSYYSNIYGGYTPYEYFTGNVVPMLTGSSYEGIKFMFDANYGKVTTFFVLHAGFEVAEKYKDFIRIETYDDCMGINYEHCVEAYLSKIMNWEGKE